MDVGVARGRQPLALVCRHPRHQGQIQQVVPSGWGWRLRDVGRYDEPRVQLQADVAHDGVTRVSAIPLDVGTTRMVLKMFVSDAVSAGATMVV